MLYPIHTMGINAWCSDLIVEPYNMETVYLMSVCGFQVAVKGIVANFLDNNGICAEIDGTDHYLMRDHIGYKVQMKKLPSGLAHAVILPKLALPKNNDERQNSFFVITKEQDILPLFFRHLDDKTEIPMHPSWASWLWKTFKRQDSWLTELKNLAGDYKGYMFNFYPTKLHDLISGAIKKKVPDIISCMTWKGENGNGSGSAAIDFT